MGRTKLRALADYIWGYGSTVGVCCMMWMTGVWIWRSCNIKIGWLSGLGGLGDSGTRGRGLCIRECAAKISTLYICISTYAPRERLEPGRRFVPLSPRGNLGIVCSSSGKDITNTFDVHSNKDELWNLYLMTT